MYVLFIYTLLVYFFICILRHWPAAADRGKFCPSERADYSVWRQVIFLLKFFYCGCCVVSENSVYGAYRIKFGQQFLLQISYVNSAAALTKQRQ